MLLPWTLTGDSHGDVRETALRPRKLQTARLADTRIAERSASRNRPYSAAAGRERNSEQRRHSGVSFDDRAEDDGLGITDDWSNTLEFDDMAPPPLRSTGSSGRVMFTGGFENTIHSEKGSGSAARGRPSRPQSAVERSVGSRQPPGQLTPVKEAGHRPKSAVVRQPGGVGAISAGLLGQGAELGVGGSRKQRPRSAAAHRGLQGMQRLDGIIEGSQWVGDENQNNQSNSHLGSSGGSGVARSGVRPRSAIDGRGGSGRDGGKKRGTRPQSAAYLRGVTQKQRHPLASDVGHTDRFSQMHGSSSLDLSGLLGASTGSSGTGPLQTPLSVFSRSSRSAVEEEEGYHLPEPAVFISDRPASVAAAAFQDPSLSQQQASVGRPRSALSTRSTVARGQRPRSALSQRSHITGASSRPQSALSRATEFSDMRSEVEEADGELEEPNGGRAKYDLVVCVCGHVGLRKARDAHMRVCPAIAAERGSNDRKKRKMAAKLKNAMLLQEWNAATKIQSVFRGYVARDYVELRRRLETMMATKVQTVWRGYSTRRRTRRLRERRERLRRERRLRACLTIQCAWRYALARRVYCLKRERAAAILIQDRKSVV